MITMMKERMRMCILEISTTPITFHFVCLDVREIILPFTRNLVIQSISGSANLQKHRMKIFIHWSSDRPANII